MWLHLPRKRTDSSIQHNPSLTPPMLIPETFKPTLWHFRCHCWSVYETKFPSQDSSQYTLHVSISHHQMKCKRQTLSTLFHLGEMGVFNHETKRQCTRTGYTTAWSYDGSNFSMISNCSKLRIHTSTLQFERSDTNAADADVNANQQRFHIKHMVHVPMIQTPQWCKHGIVTTRQRQRQRQRPRQRPWQRQRQLLTFLARDEVIDIVIATVW